MSKASEKLMTTFTKLIQHKELHEIRVTELCQLSHLNRSSFYDNFLDVYDLADQLSNEIENKYIHMIDLDINAKKLEHEFFQLFTDVKNNQEIYLAYFKIKKGHALLFKERDELQLPNRSKYLKYQSIFFRTGIVAVLKLWIEHHCEDPIEDMVELIIQKYYFLLNK